MTKETPDPGKGNARDNDAAGGLLDSAAPFETHEIATIWQQGGDAGEQPDPAELELCRLLRNDIGNAERLRRRFGMKLLHVIDVGWHAWDGARWDMASGESAATRMAHRTSRAIFGEARALALEGPGTVLVTDKETGAVHNEAESIGDFVKRVDAHRRWASTSGNAPKIKAMLEQAAPYLEARVTDLDASPWLLNLPNGTLDLQAERVPDMPDAALRPHDPADLISKVARVKYDPDAACPAFEAFLAEILPDAEVRGFLQRWFGYSLTGSTAEECLVFLYGTGANGKSTLVELLLWILGDYAMTLNFASLYHDDRKRGGEATPDIAQLPGARMVLASEPEAGVRFSESLVKTLTGDESIKARNLNKGFFEFTAEFKLTLAGNHKPTIRGQDEGIWRRIHLVPFTVQIPKERRDRKLKARLRTEAAGVLNWLIDGARMYLERGLQPPDSVAAATEQYRADSDQLGQFLADETEKVPGARVQATILYGRYCDWCRENAAEPISATLFGRRLRDRGMESEKYGVMYWRGIELRQKEEPRTPDDGSGGHG